MKSFHFRSFSKLISTTIASFHPSIITTLFQKARYSLRAERTPYGDSHAQNIKALKSYHTTLGINQEVALKKLENKNSLAVVTGQQFRGIWWAVIHHLQNLNPPFYWLVNGNPNWVDL